MQAAFISIEPLLTPLPGPDPSGPDLSLDNEFMAIERMGAGKPERQFGEKIYPAEAPQWSILQERVALLAARSRDLRVAVWLLRCGAHTDGLAGARDGLQLLSGLLNRLWDSVHPQLDATDNNDPTMRLNALMPLLSPSTVLADLRAAALAPERGSLTLRDVELALGRAKPAAGESVPTEAGMLLALEGLLQRHPGLSESIQAADQAARDIAEQVEARIGASKAPDFNPLTDLLALAVGAVGKSQASASGAPRAGDGASALSAVVPLTTGVPAVASGAIRSRDDVVRELDRVCRWIEQNEPGHPAPLLIRRAQRLLSMNFLEIIRNLAPEGLNQVANIAGPDNKA